MAQNQSVRQVQEKILETMKYIDALCRENGIVYYIMGGTALGAVRHGGFIPWDDDLDVAMLRADYERFLQIAPQYLGSATTLFTAIRRLRRPCRVCTFAPQTEVKRNTQ